MAGPINTMTKEPPERIAFIRAQHSAERAKAKAKMEAATPLPGELQPRAQSDRRPQPQKVDAKPVETGPLEPIMSMQEWGAKRYPQLAKKSHIPRSLARQLVDEYQSYRATAAAMQRTQSAERSRVQRGELQREDQRLYGERTEAMTQLQPGDLRSLESALVHEMMFGKDPEVIKAIEAAMEKFGRGPRGAKGAGPGEASEDALKAAAIQELADTGRTDGPAFSSYQRYQLATKQPQRMLPSEAFSRAMVGDPKLQALGIGGETIAGRYQAEGAQDPATQVLNWLHAYRLYKIQGAAWPQRDRERMEEFLYQQRPKAAAAIDLFDARKITEEELRALVSPEEEKFWRPADPVPAGTVPEDLRPRYDPFSPDNRRRNGRTRPPTSVDVLGRPRGKP